MFFKIKLGQVWNLFIQIQNLFKKSIFNRDNPKFEEIQEKQAKGELQKHEHDHDHKYKHKLDMLEDVEEEELSDEEDGQDKGKFAMERYN